MRAAKTVRRDLVIGEAAHALFAHLFRFTEKEHDPDFRRWNLRLRKRWVVLLHCEELAAGLLRGVSTPSEICFSAKFSAPKLVARGEVDYAKLTEASWRLVAKHHKTIMAIAIELARARKPENCHHQ
jgi:hypothetical protein